MMKKFVTAMLSLLVLATAPPALAAGSLPDGSPPDGSNMAALRQAVNTDKHALVASTLALTPVEAKKFWPIYDTYQRSVDMVGRARAMSAESLLDHDKPISNLAAKDLAKRNMLADQNEMRARRKMYNAVMRALPAAKAARYLQLEQKIRAMQAYDIAQTFPLVK